MPPRWVSRSAATVLRRSFRRAHRHWSHSARMDGIDPDPRRAIPHRCGFRVDPHRTFGCVISRMSAGAADEPHNGTDVDDRAATGFRHLLGDELCAEEHAGLVDGDDTMPAVQSIWI